MLEKLIDCHAHLIYDDINPNKVVDRMEQDALEAIISVGTSPSDILAVLKHAKANENVYAAIAFHPEYADDITEEDFKLLEELANDENVVAIGECGLDYHYRDDNKQRQKEIFTRQIEMAIRLQKPLMVHLREAEEDAIDLLKPYAAKLKALIIHCYSSVSEDVTRAFIDMGAYLSFSGNYTYKKYRIEDVKLIPKEKILVETDSPFLAPVPLRGTKNKPANVHYVAEKIAEIMGENANEMKKQFRENAKCVFNI